MWQVYLNLKEKANSASCLPSITEMLTSATKEQSLFIVAKMRSLGLCSPHSFFLLDILSLSPHAINLQYEEAECEMHVAELGQRSIRIEILSSEPTFYKS